MSRTSQSAGHQSEQPSKAPLAFTRSCFKLDQIDSWHELEEATSLPKPASVQNADPLRHPTIPQPPSRQPLPASRQFPSAQPLPTNPPQRSATPPLTPQQPLPSNSTNTQHITSAPAPSMDRPSPLIARPATFATPARNRQSLSESLDPVRPFLPWGVAIVVALLSGWGLTRLSAGYRTTAAPETHVIEIKPLLKNKEMPGASVTFTSVLAPDQKSVQGDASPAGLQLVGRGNVTASGTVSPAIAPDHPGLPAGEYVVSLSWCKVGVKDGETVAGPDLVPQNYRSPATSPLRVVVKAGSNPLATLPIANGKLRVQRASHNPE